MDHAAGIIEAFAIDRHARAAGFLENHHQLGNGDAEIHGLDIGTRNHDVLDADFAETQDIVEHGAFGRRKGRIAIAPPVISASARSSRRLEALPARQIRAARLQKEEPDLPFSGFGAVLLLPASS